MTHQYPSIVELVSTWQPLSYQDILTRDIADARATGDTDRLKTLTHDLRAAPAALTALDALTANYQLSSLLADSLWHTVRAAYEAGATWQQIARATGMTVAQACADHLGHIEQPWPLINRDTGPGQAK
jgi:hypothetical protein